jgi:hypothetical protein
MLTFSSPIHANMHSYLLWYKTGFVEGAGVCMSILAKLGNVFVSSPWNSEKRGLKATMISAASRVVFGVSLRN